MIFDGHHMSKYHFDGYHTDVYHFGWHHVSTCHFPSPENGGWHKNFTSDWSSAYPNLLESTIFLCGKVFFIFGSLTHHLGVLHNHLLPMSTNTFYLYLPSFGLTNFIPTLKISLSPSKISLTNPSNLLFCTGIVNSIHAIKRDVEVYLHSFLTSALDGGEWCGSCPAHFKARKSVPRTLYLEARWAPELLCTFLRAERYFAPIGNWTTNPQLSSPYPNNYATYACYFGYEELIFTNTMCQKYSLCESSLSFAVQLETSWPGGCTCSSARIEVCKMCCLRLVNVRSMSLHTS